MRPGYTPDGTQNCTPGFNQDWTTKPTPDTAEKSQTKMATNTPDQSEYFPTWATRGPPESPWQASIPSSPAQIMLAESADDSIIVCIKSENISYIFGDNFSGKTAWSTNQTLSSIRVYCVDFWGVQSLFIVTISCHSLLSDNRKDKRL